MPVDRVDGAVASANHLYAQPRHELLPKLVGCPVRNYLKAEFAKLGVRVRFSTRKLRAAQRPAGRMFDTHRCAEDRFRVKVLTLVTKEVSVGAAEAVLLEEGIPS